MVCIKKIDSSKIRYDLPQLKYKGRRIYFKPKEHGDYYEDWFDYCDTYTDYHEFFKKDIIYDKYGNMIY